MVATQMVALRMAVLIQLTLVGYTLAMLMCKMLVSEVLCPTSWLLVVKAEFELLNKFHGFPKIRVVIIY